MSASDATREDLSALSREDLVYKAKLAEQAERCAGDRSIDVANVDRTRDGRGWDRCAMAWRALDVALDGA